MKTYSHNYPSDITREQFEAIREDSEGAKKRTKPREIDLYSVFCAIMYIIKVGYNGECCQVISLKWES